MQYVEAYNKISNFIEFTEKSILTEEIEKWIHQKELLIKLKESNKPSLLSLRRWTGSFRKENERINQDLQRLQDNIDKNRARLLQIHDSKVNKDFGSDL